MTTFECTTPTQGRNVSAPAVVEPRVTGITPSDPGIREGLDHVLARCVIGFRLSPCRAKVAVGAAT